ncbi:elongator complex protein 3 [Bittarella massiliensis (ex Durand et al. 2017)]|uniref:Radical SAM protein n=1 Tax=Bittarella massiliensis (ex Durand et al. 2017) TaxID=1720313 RepID=A0AAW5KC89_9FIRM|nr:radical SAM protein [Bittarella massiliensis (ex Durand et al. 2017)]
MKHGNIGIFIPHLGCPQRCSFCNQNRISGAARAPSPEEVARLLEGAVRTPGFDGAHCEIAFFGGSFTAVDPAYREALLDVAEPFARRGQVAGIRLSTRPDCLDGPMARHLAARGVTAVELGAQCMDDGVLAKNRRGHTAEDVRAACRAVRAAGLELGLQMMTGLPGADRETDRRTAEAFVALAPDTVRIYPTLVMRDTELCALYEKGAYAPLSLEEAVEQTAALLRLFDSARIRVIRVGLHPDESLAEGWVAGPFHPAFRELCESRRYAALLGEALAGLPAGEYRLGVAPGHASKAVGHRGENRRALAERGQRIKVYEDGAVAPYTIRRM